MVGIDPQARASVLQAGASVAAAGTLRPLHHPLPEEAERLCDRIGILDHGRILAEGTLPDLKAQLADEEVVTLWGRFEPEAAQAALADLPEVRFLSGGEGRMAYTAKAGGAAGLLAAIYGRGLAVDRVAIDPPSLNALFLKLTGRELRD
jgi:ABC-2 type transport system ATP-binding protein